MTLKNLCLYFVFAVLVAFALPSCSETEILTQGSTPIIFSSNYVGGAGSRALGDINNNNVADSKFYVYGYSYDGTYNPSTATALFNQQVVENTGGSWTYSPVKYWDTDKKYTFTGVMPADNIPDTDVTYADGKVQITNIPITQTILADDGVTTKGIDYLVSKTVDDHTAADGTVLMQFKHILSRFSVYVYTGAMDANVILKKMNIWMPQGAAQYNEVNHSGPVSHVVNATSVRAEGDVWTWNGFDNKVDGPGTTYQEYSLFNGKEDSKVVPAYDGIPSVTDIPNGLMPVEFFVAPIDHEKFATKEDLQLYMTLEFDVTYSDSITQTITRSTPVLIHDLHSFTQNYRTNLFVKLLAETDVIAFNVSVSDFENTTDHWVDQYGYSFDLVEYAQAYDETFPQDKITGILYDYGNTDEGDSNTKMTYRIKSLTLEGSATPVVENLPMAFSKWVTAKNGTYNTETDIRTKQTPYGKFTADLSGIEYTSGYYTMVVENSMGDVREYRIYLQAPAYMAFTVTVGDNDKYTIPFVTYETVCNYWIAEVGTKIKDSGVPLTMEMVDEITQEENMNLYFKYPSNLRIDWGDSSEITKINEGEICQTDTRLTHTYTNAGDYQIIIHSDARYFESQIPQINWGSLATTYNPVTFVTNGGSTDRKIKSVDTPILRIYDEWAHWETTFGAYALAAGNGARMTWMADIVYLWYAPSFATTVKSSPLTSMFHNSSIQHTANNLFIYNGTYARAADYTFLMCPRLNNIGAGMFDYCSNIVSMISTFDGDGNQIRSIPDGLFDYLTKDIYFKQTFVGCPLTYIPSDLFAHCGPGSTYQSLGGGVTAPH